MLNRPGVSGGSRRRQFGVAIALIGAGVCQQGEGWCPGYGATTQDASAAQLIDVKPLTRQSVRRARMAAHMGEPALHRGGVVHERIAQDQG